MCRSSRCSGATPCSAQRAPLVQTSNVGIQNPKEKLHLLAGPRTFIKVLFPPNGHTSSLLWRQHDIVIRVLDWALGDLGSIPSSATELLCNLGQVHPLVVPQFPLPPSVCLIYLDYKQGLSLTGFCAGPSTVEVGSCLRSVCK